MTTKRAIPTYEQALAAVSGNMNASWRRWFHDTEVGTPPANEAVVTVTASPFTYQAPSRGFVIIHGGTVSKVTFTRLSTYTTGQTQGMFPVALGDILVVTYSSVPTITFVPT